MLQKNHLFVWALVAMVGAGLGAGCTADVDRRFERLSPSQTGVDFVNPIPADDSLMNPLDFFYVYNGGGVAAGDVNGDGRTDLYFTGNRVANRLYLNRGGWRFEDVTERTGVGSPGRWSTGVALVDINQDGRLDLYVSTGGPLAATTDRANRLYVNQGAGPEGVPRFVERAAAYGIDDRGYSTHAAFFDYDRDGDLDLYVLNAAMVGEGRTARRLRAAGRNDDRGADRLYRNDGDGTFADVTRTAGIDDTGHGLGVAISDLNGDGWPDIYVANDFISLDRVYANNGDGTFTNRSAQYLKHQSFSAMGVDVADVNHDARPDVFVLDMLPTDPQRRRVTSNTGVRYQGEFQFGRNTLQLNQGTGPAGLLPFSEIGTYAGVEATGWGWAPLLADYDNDGDRDLFVTNGYGEFVTHLDFVRRREQVAFSGTAAERRAALREALSELPRLDLANRFFENRTEARWDVRFTDRTGQWASERPGISNGAVFADLDQDGDLDLVTNNINETATLLQNQTAERGGGRAVRVRLHGPAGNRGGLGATVTLFQEGRRQYHEHSTSRGYQSTVEPVIHFGVGVDTTADSLHVTWPDGTTQRRVDVPAGAVVDIRHEASGAQQPVRPVQAPTASLRPFEPVGADRGLVYEHEETAMPEFDAMPLLPHKYAQNGPGIAIGDVNGDGRDDVFVGADRGRKRMLLIQTRAGQFQQRAVSMDRRHQDMGALFFDADGDADHDLYVVSGGNLGAAGSAAYQDRLYLNDGQGRLQHAPDALPALTTSGSVVTAGDYDRDGDLDLFVGGRVRPGQYPLPPRSYLLRNDADGETVRFADVTRTIAPDLAEVGLVTSALWTDFDGNGTLDLAVAGEWMPLTLFAQNEGRFAEVTEAAGLDGTTGWWNSLTGGDFDHDGDTDYVAGNLGLNTRYRAVPGEPLRVHAKDFDDDGRIDPVLSHVLAGTRYPAHGRDELTEQIIGMIRRFPSYEAYSEASLDDVFTRDEMAGAYAAEAAHLAASYFENQGDGTFAVRALPAPAQLAPMFGLQAGDYDGDDALDLLLVGNWHAPDWETGRADASVGVFLRGDGAGGFRAVGPSASGFVVEGDAKALATLSVGRGAAAWALASQNGGPLKAFRLKAPAGRYVRLQPTDRYAEITFGDGTTRREELYHGSGYLSQSSRVLHVPESAQSVTVYGAEGAPRSVPVDPPAANRSGQ